MKGEELVVVAFDGECLMCSRGVRFLAARDRHRRLRFVTLQSPLGQEMERRAGTPELSTMITKKGDEVLSRSDGALATLEALGGGWALLAGAARIFPRSLRDAVYGFIAARRHRWFGKGDACAMPSEALRERLIDGKRV
jgi:predicted DCC family thiol-disulfide oxidoreductase YuxK